MKLRWYAHSCFRISTEERIHIVTDPFDSAIGYALSGVTADIVTISHDHYDHNNLAAISGTPVILREEGSCTVKGIEITAIKSFHDAEKGERFGNNLIFVFAFDGLRIAHLGDLGDMPDDAAMQKLGHIDVLLAPVGGLYTISPNVACDIANIVTARVLIPMHYQTPGLALDKPILGVDTLLSVAKNCHIHKLNQSECIMQKESLGEDRILVLDPSCFKV